MKCVLVFKRPQCLEGGTRIYPTITRKRRKDVIDGRHDFPSSSCSAWRLSCKRSLLVLRQHVAHSLRRAHPKKISPLSNMTHGIYYFPPPLILKCTASQTHPKMTTCKTWRNSFSYLRAFSLQYPALYSTAWTWWFNVTITKCWHCFLKKEKTTWAIKSEEIDSSSYMLISNHGNFWNDYDYILQTIKYVQERYAAIIFKDFHTRVVVTFRFVIRGISLL